MSHHRLDTIATRRARGPGALPDVAPPLRQTSTFSAVDDAAFTAMANTQRHNEYYTRDGNPTVAEAERLIASLEDAEACLLTASGMSAMSTAPSPPQCGPGLASSCSKRPPIRCSRSRTSHTSRASLGAAAS